MTLTNPANTPPPGGFEVSKIVTGNGNGLVPSTQGFTVEYEYIAGDGTHVTGSFVVSASDPNGLDNLPAGTVVTLAEPVFPPIPGVDWTGLEWGGDATPLPDGRATVTIGAGGMAQVSLTNTATRLPNGSFTITKTVQGAGDIGDATFQVQFEWADGPGYPANSGTRDLVPGVPVTVGDVPPGALVTLTETLPDIQGVDFGDPLWTGATRQANPLVATFIASSDGSDVTIGLLNIADGVPGSFTVTKTVTGSGDIRGAIFEVDYSFPAANGIPAGSGRLELVPGVPQTVRAVPPGVTVTLTETIPAVQGVVFGNPEWTGATPPNAQEPQTATFVSSADGSDVTIGLLNRSQVLLTSFTVTKSVTGAGPVGGATYEVAYSWPQSGNGPAGTGTLHLVPGAPQQVGDVPPGVTVTLTETLPVIPGVDFGDPAWDGARVPDPANPLEAIFVSNFTGTDVRIGLENVADAVPGSFTVTKAVGGEPPSRRGTVPR